MAGFHSHAADVRRVVVGAVVVCALSAVVAVSYPEAQSTTRAAAARAVSDDPALNAILLELRGLRADLAGGNQRMLAAQLLVGRVQMQEQRIAHLDGQRAQGAAKLSDASTAARLITEQLTKFESACGKATDVSERRACGQELDAMKRQVAPLQASEQQLRLELANLENAVSTEQQRWSEFNDRLDVLERSLTGR